MKDVFIVKDEIVNRLSKISTPNISDAMFKGLSKKFKNHTMDSGIRPISTDFKICAPAYTVNCYPGATYAMERAIVEAPAGSAIVCNGKGSDAGVMMGELMSTVAQKRGLLGAVIDGAVRDINEVIELNFPLFSRHIVAQSGTADQLGELMVPITCGGVVVYPGDIVVADINGVVVVPSDISSAVVKAAEKLAQWEDDIKEELLKGMTLEEAAKIHTKPELVQI